MTRKQKREKYKRLTAHMGRLKGLIEACRPRENRAQGT